MNKRSQTGRLVEFQLKELSAQNKLQKLQNIQNNKRKL